MTREEAMKRGFSPFDNWGDDYQLVEGKGKVFVVKFSTGELMLCNTITLDDGTKMVRTKRNAISGKDMACALTGFVNNYSCEREAFVAAMMVQHRTLQQSVFKLFAMMVKEWAAAYKEDRFDDRNAKTCEVSKRIMSALGEDMEYIPFI